MRRETKEEPSSSLAAFGFVIAMMACAVCFMLILPPIIPIAVGVVYLASLLFRSKPQAQCDQCHLLYDRSKSRKCPKCGCYRVVQ